MTTKQPYQDSSFPVAQRVGDLLARMTLEEKVGQLRSQMIYDPDKDTRDYSAGHVRSLTHCSHYNDNDGKPLFPFGFGLSYSTFEYGNLVISPERSDGKSPVTVRVDVRNTSTVAGDEVVQLYLHDEVASVAVPVKDLRGFARISLIAGEKKTVSFTLHERDLALWNRKMRLVVESGVFDIMVGSSSEDIRLRGRLNV